MRKEALHSCSLPHELGVFILLYSVKRFALIEHHDGTIPPYNFVTTLITLGS